MLFPPALFLIFWTLSKKEDVLNPLVCPVLLTAGSVGWAGDSRVCGCSVIIDACERGSVCHTAEANSVRRHRCDKLWAKIPWRVAN